MINNNNKNQLYKQTNLIKEQYEDIQDLQQIINEEYYKNKLLKFQNKELVFKEKNQTQELIFLRQELEKSKFRERQMKQHMQELQNKSERITNQKFSKFKKQKNRKRFLSCNIEEDANESNLNQAKSYPELQEISEWPFIPEDSTNESNEEVKNKNLNTNLEFKTTEYIKFYPIYSKPRPKEIFLTDEINQQFKNKIPKENILFSEADKENQTEIEIDYVMKPNYQMLKLKNQFKDTSISHHSNYSETDVDRQQRKSQNKKIIKEKIENRINNQLFKQFLIIGVDNKSVENNNNNSNKKQALLKIIKHLRFFLKPKILFDYSNENVLEQERKKVIQMFSFPFDVKVEKIALTKSFSNINQQYFSLIKINNFQELYFRIMSSSKIKIALFTLQIQLKKNQPKCNLIQQQNYTILLSRFIASVQKQQISYQIHKSKMLKTKYFINRKRLFYLQHNIHSQTFLLRFL